ncbi:inverse autotransporter beta domain-containing protein [Pantoea cypripedii]|uniref:Ig-like domain-containing protein n=1 Tax=Pantoea cypripedii TaxID=55209 RepID=UPI002FC87136
MTERTNTRCFRWQSLVILFHYLFTLLFFSLPVKAGNSSEVRLPILSPGEQIALVSAQTTPGLHPGEDSQPFRDHMVQFWGSAQNASATEAARGTTNSYLNGLLTSEVERWLNMSGAKARLTLDTGLAGRHYRDVGLDYFYPLIEWQDNTLFTQLSFHRWNDRNQFNIGLGLRHDINDHWLLGGNVFYDRDISRKHSRMGVGGEAWGERVRGSVNYYLPLSNWHLSNDNSFNDDPLRYRLYERPARGWDLNIEAAASQHVAIKGTYFQWYGDKVDVNGTRSQASRDPRGVTVGTRWQPIPLLSMNAEYSAISGQNNDARLGLALNWQFGRTLSQMLNPAASTALPLLKEARHDFVIRNNNIILAYQQRDKKLRLYFEPQSLSTKAGSEPFIHAVKGGRSGFIVYHSSQPDVVQLINEQAGLVAPLKRGEVIISAEEYQDASRTKLYDRAEYRLTVQPGDYAPAVSNVHISGESTIGSMLTGSYTFITNEGEDEAEQKSAQRWYRANAPGEVLSVTSQYQLTAADIGTTLIYEVTPVNKAGLQGPPASAQQTGPLLSMSSLIISGVTGGGELLEDGRIKFKAGDSGTLFFEAKVQDKDGNPAQNLPVYWSHGNPDLGQLEHTRQMTNSNGESLVKFNNVTSGGEDTIIASLQPGEGRLRVMNDTVNMKKLPFTVTFSAATNIKFVNPPQEVTAGSKVDFIVQVTDQEHAAMENVALQITSQGETSLYVTGKDGRAWLSLTAPITTESAKWLVTAKMSANTEITDKAIIGLVADGSNAQVTELKASPASAAAGSAVTLSAAVKDKHGNPVANAQVEFLTAATGGTLLTTLSTDDKGEVSFPDYTQTEAKTYHPAARVSGGTAKTTAVTFTADGTNAQVTELKATPASAAAGSAVTLSAAVKDKHGNPVANAQVEFLSAATGGTLLATLSTDDKGEVSFPDYTQTEAKTYHPAARVSGGTAKTTAVTFTADGTNAQVTELKATPASAAAGSAVMLSAAVKDKHGNPVANAQVECLTAATGGTVLATLSTDDKGEVSFPDYTQTEAKIYHPAARVSGGTAKAVTVEFTADNSNAQVTELKASPASAAAGSAVTLSAAVKDKHGNPVANAQVEFLSAATGGTLLTTLSTDDKGEVSYPDYTQTEAKTYHPAARVTGGTAKTTAVTFTADGTNAQVTELKATPASAAAGSAVTLSAAVKDKHGNPVANAQVDFLSAATGGTLLTTFSTDDKGEVSYPDYTQTEAKVYHPAARVSGGTAKTTAVTFTADGTNAQVTELKATPASAAAGSAVMLSAAVKDKHGNPVANAQVEFLTAATGGTVLATLSTDDKGEVSFPDYTQTEAKIYHPAARVSGGTAKATAVTFTPGEVASLDLKRTFTGDLLADGSTKASWKVTARDVHQNLVPTAALTWQVKGPVSNIIFNKDEVTNDKGEGLLTVTLPTKDGALEVVVQHGSVKNSDSTILLPVLKLISLEASSDSPVVGTDLTMTAMVTNLAGDPQQNVVVNFTNDRKEWMTEAANIKTDAQGMARTILRIVPGKELGAPGNYVVTAALKDKPSEKQTKAVSWQVNMAGLQIKEFKAAPATTEVGKKVVLSATVQDNYGNPIQNVEVEFLSKMANGVVMAKSPTNDHGLATYSDYMMTKAGDYYPAARVVGSTAKETKVTFIVDVAGAQVTDLKADPASVAAGKEVKLLATVKDKYGNLVTNGQTRVTFLTSKSGAALPGESVATNGEGVATYAYSQQNRGEYKPAARVGNTSAQEVTVWFLGTPSITSVSVKPAGPVASGSSLLASHNGFDSQGTGNDNSRYQWYKRKLGTTQWIAIDKSDAKEKLFRTDATLAGFEVQAGVTPKGSMQSTLGEEKFSSIVKVYGTPSITSVNVSPKGTIATGVKLTATHSGFNSEGTGSDDSRYQWLYRKLGESEWKEVAYPAGVQKNLTPDKSYGGYEVQVRVTAKGSEQQSLGNRLFSDVITIYGTPSIVSVGTSPNGTVTPNVKLTATYSGFDAQGTGNDSSFYQWYKRKQGDSAWVEADKSDAKQKMFTPDDRYVGFEVRVGVTPKGSSQSVTGEQKYSDPVKINNTIVPDPGLIEVTYGDGVTTVIGEKFHTDFVVTARQQGQLLPNVPICQQIIEDLLPRTHRANTNANGTVTIPVEVEPEMTGIFISLSLRFAYCKDGNPAAADFSKSRWVKIINI